MNGDSTDEASELLRPVLLFPRTCKISISLHPGGRHAKATLAGCTACRNVSFPCLNICGVLLHEAFLISEVCAQLERITIFDEQTHGRTPYIIFHSELGTEVCQQWVHLLTVYGTVCSKTFSLWLLSGGARKVLHSHPAFWDRMSLTLSHPAPLGSCGKEIYH